MNSHWSAGGTDAATKMAGAPEPGGPGGAVATLAPGRILARDRPRPRSSPQGGAPDPGGDRGLHSGPPPAQSAVPAELASETRVSEETRVPRDPSWPFCDFDQLLKPLSSRPPQPFAGRLTCPASLPCSR